MTSTKTTYILEVRNENASFNYPLVQEVTFDGEYWDCCLFDSCGNKVSWCSHAWDTKSGAVKEARRKAKNVEGNSIGCILDMEKKGTLNSRIVIAMAKERSIQLRREQVLRRKS